MLIVDSSSMYMLATCRQAQRSAISASLAPAASPASLRSLSHSSTRSSRGECAASKACSFLRISCTIAFENLQHLTASAALPKQQRPSTLTPSAEKAPLRQSSPRCLPKRL